MFEANKVIIAPELKVKDLQAKDMELDEIIEYALNKGYDVNDILYEADAFQPVFLDMLQNDKAVLERLNQEWEQEEDDPKFELFRQKLENEFLKQEINPAGKLVLFSESVDTLTYLKERMTSELGRTDVLMVTASNRSHLGQTIKENFDANYPCDSRKYNIIITSDVLAEGVNLHRSNVIVNYDSPWNATRLMQRIGRVNRIGSMAPNIYNYMFYPSQQGDKEIQLYKNALVKLQGFHSAFGEDAQIYSKEEIVKEFKMFDNHIKDSIDQKIALLREVRELYNTNRKLYHKIKSLPMKSRVARNTGKHTGKSVIFVSSNVKTEFYLATTKGVEVIDFLEAVKYLKAKPEEQPVPFVEDGLHYQHVNRALNQYMTEYVEASDTSSINRTDLDKTSLEANKFLRTIKQIASDTTLKSHCDVLTKYIEEGIYAQLPIALKNLSREYKNDRVKIKQDEYKLQAFISGLLREYQTMNTEQHHDAQDISDPQIIISETFI
jgi:superfamily II DNA/RNA helicase